MVELTEAGLDFQEEQQLDVYYPGRIVGHFQADLIVEGRLILELKACEALTKAHEVQLVNYLTTTGIDEGLLLNFGGSSLECKKEIPRLSR